MGVGSRPVVFDETSRPVLSFFIKPHVRWAIKQQWYLQSRIVLCPYSEPNCTQHRSAPTINILIFNVCQNNQRQWLLRGPENFMRLFSELQAGTVAGIHIYLYISHHVHFSTCLISMKIKREYAGVVLIWIIRGKKASHATAQIYIEHRKSN